MGKNKVLIIDDEKDFLMLAKLNLEKTDKYEVLTLSSAKGIIYEVNNFRPDIILLDILMPGLGGIEVCEMLNNDPVGSKIPIIIVSALSKDKDKLIAYKVGVSDYLVKPVSRDELINKIDKVLRQKRDES